MKFIKDWGAVVAVLLAIIGGVYKFARLEERVLQPEKGQLIQLHQQLQEIGERVDNIEKRKNESTIQKEESFEINKNLINGDTFGPENWIQFEPTHDLGASEEAKTWIVHIIVRQKAPWS